MNTHRLDKIDRKLLTAIEQDVRIPISALAKKIHVSRTVAEYRLKQFEEKGIIRGYYAVFDPSRFGFTAWKLWVTIKDKKAFTKSTKNHPRLWWYASCAGVYDAVLCILCKTPHDFASFLETLQGISSSAMVMNVSLEYHTRSYLTNTEPIIETAFQEQPHTEKIPANTHHILKLLSENARMSYTELANRTGKNVKTIRSALKSLKESGIIVSYRPSINATKFGYEFYKVLVYTDSDTKKIIQWTRLQKHIVAVISCVGPWQLELEVEIDSYRALCELLGELKEHFPAIRRYESLLITDEINVQSIDTLLQQTI
ncbi:MAG: Lrp/AsnC family transcriptional regulator [Candidatus Woesearchaeota archaeon]|nr:Lrp/AsnC family transcriptional regulator [Candidatus Woesearchaeota archaeon]